MKIFNLCCNSPGEGGGGGGQQQKITLWFKNLQAICPVGKMFTGYEKPKFSLALKPLANLKMLPNFVSKTNDSLKGLFKDRTLYFHLKRLICAG